MIVAESRPIPALEKKPELLDGLEFYFQAYRDLENDRSIGFGVMGPIPWSSIINWCRLHGIYDINEIETIKRYIRAMESADFQFEERKKERAKKKRKAKKQ